MRSVEAWGGANGPETIYDYFRAQTIARQLSQKTK
jgi:hypothetical protein